MGDNHAIIFLRNGFDIGSEITLDMYACLQKIAGPLLMQHLAENLKVVILLNCGEFKKPRAFTTFSEMKRMIEFSAFTAV